MSRRTLTKFAHIASLLVIFGLTATVGLADAPTRIAICHWHQNGFVLIVVPPEAASVHVDDRGNFLIDHALDRYSTDGTSCSFTDPSPTPPPGDDPDPTPEPVTMLLFGAGVAGVGYAVRKLRRKGDGTQE